MSYTNSDGLFVLTDGDQGAVKDNGGALAATKVLVVEIPDATKLGTAQTAPTANDAFIPAGSYRSEERRVGKECRSRRSRSP